MSFGYIHTLEDIEPDCPVAVRGAGGIDIEIHGAFLVVSAIEVHLCESARLNRPGDSINQAHNPGARFGWLYDWLIPQAQAHVPSSATRLGTPFVEDLLAQGRARIIDEIAPPLATYCAFFAVIAPADDDVINLSGLQRADIVGKSMILRGRWRPDASADWQPFESASTRRDVIRLDAMDPKTGGTPLTLGAEDPERMVLLDKRISPDLFEGLSAAQLDTPVAADLLLDRLEPRLKIFEFDR